MFAVRGEKIILQDRDDDFLMECEVSGTEEVSKKLLCILFLVLTCICCIRIKYMISHIFKQVIFYTHGYLCIIFPFLTVHDTFK